MPELPVNTDKIQHYIGKGSQRAVFEHPRDTNKVVKVELRETPENKQEYQKMHLLGGMEFYLTKMLHIMYPDDIPDIHLSSIKTGKRQTIHDRVEAEPPPHYFKSEIANKVHRHTINILRRLLQPNPEHDRIADTFNQAGVPIDEKNTFNFGTNPNGTTTYVDGPYFNIKRRHGRVSVEHIVHTDITRLEQAIKGIPDEHQKRKAESYFGRFKALLQNYDTLLQEES